MVKIPSKRKSNSFGVAERIPPGPLIPGVPIPPRFGDGRWQVAVSGNYAYVTCYNSDNLVVVDITNPLVPVEKGNVTSTAMNEPRGMAVSGKYVYVSSYIDDALVVVDVSDPNAPVVKGSVTSTNLNGARDVAMVPGSNYVYVAGYVADTLVAVDITDPDNPVEITSVYNATTLNGGMHMAISDGYAYVTSYIGEYFTVLEISESSIHRDETGAVVSSAVWTGTNPDGTADADRCSDWGSGGGGAGAAADGAGAECHDVGCGMGRRRRQQLQMREFAAPVLLRAVACRLNFPIML